MDDINKKLDYIITKLDKIENDINNINNKQAKIEKTSDNMNNHIEFITNIYDNVRKPVETVANTIFYYTGYKNKIELPNRNNLLENNLENINDID